MSGPEIQIFITKNIKYHLRYKNALTGLRENYYSGPHVNLKVYMQLKKDARPKNKNKIKE